jgi:hypothetical protein
MAEGTGAVEAKASGEVDTISRSCEEWDAHQDYAARLHLGLSNSEPGCPFLNELAPSKKLNAFAYSVAVFPAISDSILS